MAEVVYHCEMTSDYDFKREFYWNVYGCFWLFGTTWHVLVPLVQLHDMTVCYQTYYITYPVRSLVFIAVMDRDTNAL